MKNNPYSPDHAAVLHLLASPLIEARSEAYIHDGDFDWKGLFAEAASMSGGERLLVRIAYDLWTAKGVAGIWEIPRSLDRGNFERVIDALHLCRYGVSDRLELPEPARDAA